MLSFMMNITTPLLVSTFFIGAFVIASWLLLGVGQRPRDYPPGPPTLPIIGNLHQMPTKDMHLTFAKWAEEYGDIYSLILGSQTMVVLNSDEAVKELFDRRGGIYADRPDAFIGQNLASGGLRMILLKYGARWRMARRIMHGLLNRAAAIKFTPFQDLETKQLLNDLLETPDDFLKHLRRLMNATTTSGLYGWRTPTYEDPLLQQLFNEFEKLTELLQRPEAALFDVYPVLRRLPDFLAPVKRHAKAMHKKEHELYLGHWLRAKQAFHEKTIPPCYCIGLIELQEKEGFTDSEAAYMVGNLLEAGSDTTANTLYAFVQAMILFPDVQARAHAEIDRICGADHLPGLEDKERLTYVRCLMKETLRWGPTTIAGGLPHATTAADSYAGFTIPKGAWVINNSWTINMDPRRASEPRVFDPDRYKDDHLDLADSAAHRDPRLRDNFTFGAGRRACPGMHVAENSLYFAIARILWAFEIRPVVREDGTEVVPDPGRLTPGVICRPVDFGARITVRSEERARVVRGQWGKAERECLDKETGQWRVGRFEVK